MITMKPMIIVAIVVIVGGIVGVIFGSQQSQIDEINKQLSFHIVSANINYEI